MWNPGPALREMGKTPLTLISGFFGSGKTTLLNHLLARVDGRRMAVIVNDLGRVNIDAALIKGALKDLKGAIAGMLELQGGCICCSIQSDLLDALLELVEDFQPDHILIEATGAAEPMAILKTLYSDNFFGVRGIDFLNVANTVTVLDGGNFEAYFSADRVVKNRRRNRLLLNDHRRPLDELLIDQIECADILLINKVDLLPGPARDQFRRCLEALNPSAIIMECEEGAVDPNELFGEQRFGEERTLAGAGWRKAIEKNEEGRKIGWKFSEANAEVRPMVLRSSKGGVEGRPSTTDYGLETFVFNARKPFLESRFLKLLRQGLKGVIRAKGFYWTEEVPNRVGIVSIAGKTLRADYLAEWWQVRVDRGEVSLDDLPDIVKKSWLPVLGDRRQEIVLIGVDLDRQFIEEALRGCLTKAVRQ